MNTPECEDESKDVPVDILKLSGWQILDEYEEEHLYRFTVKVSAPASSCLLCGACVAPYRFGMREHEFADLPMHGKQVRIRARLQRYRCKTCRRTFLDPTPSMSEQHSATMGVVAYPPIRTNLSKAESKRSSICDDIKYYR